MQSKIQSNPIIKTIPLGNAAPLGKHPDFPAFCPLLVVEWGRAGIFGVESSDPLAFRVMSLLSYWHSQMICIGLADSPSLWVSLLYSPGGSLVESPEWASTMEAPCQLALSSAALSVPYGMGVGVLWGCPMSVQDTWKQSLGKPLLKANGWALRSLMWGSPGMSGRFILESDTEFEVAPPLSFPYLTIKKNESQNGKLGSSLRLLPTLHHPQPPETERVGFAPFPICPKPFYC